MEPQPSNHTSWLDRPLSSLAPKISLATVLSILILLIAVISRFYHVDLRVMSHDEINHVIPSLDFYQGRGYDYDPVTHGPLQFHLIALSYFLLGDNDFSSRVPYALIGVAVIGVVLFAFRRYLGKAGALIGGFLFLISPYMLYYSRYTRNEIIGVLIVLLTIYAVLRYLEKGDRFSLFMYVVVMALDFTDKATSYIFTAQLLLFLLVLLVDAVQHVRWNKDGQQTQFRFLMFLTILMLLVTLAFAVWNSAINKVSPEEATAVESATVSEPMTMQKAGELVALGLAVVCGLGAVVTLVRGIGWRQVRMQRPFDLIMVTGVLILPLLSPIPVKLLGWNPLDYSSLGMQRTGAFIVLLTILSVAIGLWWKPRLYPVFLAIFYAIFTVFYTTFFTNGIGFFKGMVGALGYWMAQQAVNRGSQPWYYYILLHLPIYEYLEVLGAGVALYFGLRFRKFLTRGDQEPYSQPPVDEGSQPEEQIPLPFEETLAGEVEMEQAVPLSSEALNTHLHSLAAGAELESTGTPRQAAAPLNLEAAAPARKSLAQVLGFTAEDWAVTAPSDPAERVEQPVPVLAFFLFWAVTSTVAFSLAGEKMPWLTTHIAVGFLLAAAWGLGYLVNLIPWKKVLTTRGITALLLMPVLVTSFAALVGSLLGPNLPFQGTELVQLQATSNFILGLVGFVLSGWGVVRLLSGWNKVVIARLLTVVVFAFLAVLTARTAFTASYINYDNAKEFVVYAHSASGPKEILAQVEEISRRTTKGKDVMVAYVGDALYPYWWYFRDYPNKRWFGNNPTRELANYPLIIVDEANYSRMDSIVRDNYVSFEYLRMVWPMQDYWNLTWERIWNAISNPQMRKALFDIWLNRDYTLYGQLTNNQNLTLTTWSPAAKMRFYIRKDIVAQIWNYGSSPVIEQTTQTDPYAGLIQNLQPQVMMGGTGTAPGLFQAPRAIAIAPDGTLYVADSRNHRIQHLTTSGEVLQVWGAYADATKGDAPGGTFNEPWGVAVDSQGNVYVADTWNYRIQKFTADGQFIKMWGSFGQADSTEGMYGPRALAFDANDHLYVTDTGNKRILIFNTEGQYLSQFGTVGMDSGQFDEPVGIGIGPNGEVVVADTWNQRIQVFTPDASGLIFTPTRAWEVYGWFSNSLENKPYLAVDKQGNVFVTDPEGIRVLMFDMTGKFITGWGDYASDAEGFSLPVGVAVDAQGGIWVTDAGANRLVYYKVP